MQDLKENFSVGSLLCLKIQLAEHLHCMKSLTADHIRNWVEEKGCLFSGDKQGKGRKTRERWGYITNGHRGRLVIVMKQRWNYFPSNYRHSLQSGKSGPHLSTSFLSQLLMLLCCWKQTQIAGLKLISDFLASPFDPCFHGSNTGSLSSSLSTTSASTLLKNLQVYLTTSIYKCI